MRKCIFCEDKATTREDIWPLWLIDMLPSGGIVEAERGGIPLGVWSSDKPMRVRCVCQSCNNGWMSDCEGKVRPIITGLINDELNEIGSDQQIELSLWAVMKAMLAENLYPERPRYYTQKERAELFRDHKIPMRTSVTIAKCIDHLGLYTLARNLSGKLCCGTGDSIFYVTTFGVQTVAIQVQSIRLSSIIPENMNITYEQKNWPWENMEFKVWPIMSNEIKWPNRVALNGLFGLEEYANRYSLDEGV